MKILPWPNFVAAGNNWYCLFILRETKYQFVRKILLTSWIFNSRLRRFISRVPQTRHIYTRVRTTVNYVQFVAKSNSYPTLISNISNVNIQCQMYTGSAHVEISRIDKFHSGEYVSYMLCTSCMLVPYTCPCVLDVYDSYACPHYPLTSISHA